MIEGALKLALLAEGQGELAASSKNRIQLAPFDTIDPEQLGAGHRLVARITAEGRPIAFEAVQFVSPLRVRGREAKGSDLVTPATLRALLAAASKRSPSFKTAREKLAAFLKQL